MRELRVRIVCVDMYGYCGRDFHPQPSDVGKEVVVHTYARWEDGEGDRAYNYGVYEGVIDGETPPRKVELIDHEVELCALRDDEEVPVGS